MSTMLSRVAAFIKARKHLVHTAAIWAGILLSLVLSIIALCNGRGSGDQTDSIILQFTPRNFSIFASPASPYHQIGCAQMTVDCQAVRRRIDFQEQSRGTWVMRPQDLLDTITRYMDSTGCAMLTIPVVVRTKFTSDGRKREDQSLYLVTVERDRYFAPRIEYVKRLSRKYDPKITGRFSAQCAS